MRHDIDKIVSILRETVAGFKDTVVREIVNREKSPFRILITTVLSLRTKDEVTRSASERLFEKAKTPAEMLSIPEDDIAKLIYPVGFYKNKARVVRDICGVLLEKYGGGVPDDLDELLKLHGVGRKTANLVLSQGFDKDAICVDTHVHRISNRLGYVKTKTPEETEFALREKLPQKYWREINDLLVSFGQNLCKPISPYCSRCPIHNHCMRIGVETSR